LANNWKAAFTKEEQEKTRLDNYLQAISYVYTFTSHIESILFFYQYYFKANQHC